MKFTQKQPSSKKSAEKSKNQRLQPWNDCNDVNNNKLFK